MIEVVGTVTPGIGVAAGHIGAAAGELEIILGERLVPGSLNVMLDRPLMLKPSAALRFDGDHRLLWPARLNGKPVWFYRWAHAPLHVAEFVASVHLRNELGLADGDKVRIELDQAMVGPTPRIAWTLLWKGREDCLRNGQYNWLTSKLGIHTGFGLQRFSPLKAAEGISRLLRRAPRPYAFERMGARTEQQKILNLLNYTKTSGSSYSARHFPAGYHSIDLPGITLRGQRKPAERLAQVPLDFTGKAVLDLGSNQGGMLLALADKLRWGVGVDYDSRMVNTANRIASAKDASQLDFYVFNLERENLDLIRDMLPQDRVDVCFLLSVCMWLKNWKQVIDFAASVADRILFESNGTDEQQDEQIAYLRSVCRNIEMLADESEDDPGQKKRRLVLAQT